MIFFIEDSMISTRGKSMHYGEVIMGTIASQIPSLIIVYSTVYSGADQRKHQSSASLAFVRWIHWGPVNSTHKWPVMWKMFPFDDVIIVWLDNGLGLDWEQVIIYIQMLTLFGHAYPCQYKLKRVNIWLVMWSKLFLYTNWSHTS